MMSAVFNGRCAARIDKPVALFLIGMRLNKLWAIHKWLPVVAAMPSMLKELRSKPETGLLFYRLYYSGRVLMAQQYWDSFDSLLAYAHDASAKHFPAWAAFNRAVGKSGDVGIWHETYLIEPGKFECVYANMPLFGLAAAARRAPAEGGLSAARDRLRATD